MDVTVYGHTGVVGAQLYRWLKEQGANVAGVSLDHRDGEPGGEWAFLCLPTPTVDRRQDTTAIASVLGQVTADNVVIRSTVLPGTCAEYQKQYPEKNIYHWPEFLSARTAWDDFTHPRARIVGGDREIAFGRAIWAHEIEPLLPAAAYVEYMDWDTSEMVKYAHNIHGAMQVIFANTIYDACERSAADWEAIRAIAPLLGYVSPEQANAYWNVWKDGKRGYGGTCFPKDTQALAGWLRGQAELLEGMEAANARLRALEAGNG